MSLDNLQPANFRDNLLGKCGIEGLDKFLNTHGTVPLLQNITPLVKQEEVWLYKIA